MNNMKFYKSTLAEEGEIAAKKESTIKKRLLKRFIVVIFPDQDIVVCCTNNRKMAFELMIKDFPNRAVL